MIEVLGTNDDGVVAAIVAVLSSMAERRANRPPTLRPSPWKLAMRLPDAELDDIRIHAAGRCPVVLS